MKLRIVSGTLRGRMLSLDDKKLAFRPTLERARQSLADSLEPRIYGARVADLCAGSGSFGFEMVSRGAAHVTFVEKDGYCMQGLRLHVEKYGVASQCAIIKQDIREFVKRETSGYDILYFDPPYDDAALATLVPQLIGLLSDGGVLLHERRKIAGRGAMENMGGRLFATKIFGETAVDFYSRTSEEFMK